MQLAYHFKYFIAIQVLNFSCGICHDLVVTYEGESLKTVDLVAMYIIKHICIS